MQKLRGFDSGFFVLLQCTVLPLISSLDLLGSRDDGKISQLICNSSCIHPQSEGAADVLNATHPQVSIFLDVALYCTDAGIIREYSTFTTFVSSVTNSPCNSKQWHDVYQNLYGASLNTLLVGIHYQYRPGSLCFVIHHSEPTQEYPETSRGRSTSSTA